MKYCPVCGAEYYDHKERCADCDETLFAEHEYKALKEQKEEILRETKRFKKICVLEDRFEGDLVTAALQREGIPAIIREYKDTAYDGIYIPQKGWGCVMVPEKWEVRATEIIHEVEQAFKEKGPGSTDEAEHWVCSECGQEISEKDSVCPRCAARFEGGL
jgi:rubrerythrin